MHTHRTTHPHRIIAAISLCALVLGALAGCASPRRPSNAQLQAGARALERAGAVADPGLVAARDIAFAKAAREEGQWPAFVSFAAPGALREAPGGFLTPEMMAGEAAPDNPWSWAPTAVWSSCDGSMAISFGRYAEAGLVGSYVTAWARDRGQPYQWTYNAGVLDDPQPVAREDQLLDGGEDVIVVAAMDVIDARTADCPRAGETVPPPPPVAPDPAKESALARSADNTLQWYWEHRPDGEKRVVVEYLREGNWQRPLELVVQVGS